MLETVCKIDIKLKDVAIDKKRNAIVFSNISEHASKSVDLIANLLTLLAKIANSKSSPIQHRRKSIGFKFDARKFSVVALEDHIQINYDFSESSSDLVHSAKEIVCDVLNLHLSGITKSITQLKEVDEPAFDSYEASNFSKVDDAYEAIKILHEITKNQGVEGFDIQVDGYDDSHKIEINRPPERPDFRADSNEISFIGYEISDVHKTGPCIEIIPESGKGKKSVLVNVEQYSALQEKEGFSIDKYVLFDFSVKQIAEKQYVLIRFAPSGVQNEIEHK